MLNNVAFIGGIHGVGKSTICKEICSSLGLVHLSASEVLKWKDINTDVKNKKVDNIPFTQNLLITNLASLVSKDERYLLDGHYCLLNKDNQITDVPISTFKEIKPVSLNLIVGFANEIKNRLEQRDGKSYSLELVEEMQERELTHARIIATSLNVDLNIGTQEDFSKILAAIQNSLPK
jgi:adenylate kinase